MRNQERCPGRPDLQPALELPEAQRQNPRAALVSAFYKRQYPLAHSTSRDSRGLADGSQREHGMRGGIIF